MVAFSFHSPTLHVRFCFVVFVSGWSNILNSVWYPEIATAKDVVKY